LRVKTIAILLTNLHCGGAERVAVNIANELVKRGFSVHVVLMVAEGDLLIDLHPDIRVVDLHRQRLRSVLTPLVRYLRQDRPDAFLACMWPLTVIALWARILSRVHTRIVVVEHTTWSRAELAESAVNRWLIRTTMHLFFPHADAIVAVSQGAAHDLANFARIDPERISVVYNPVVGEEKSSVGNNLPPDGWWLGTHRRILAVGSLVAVKNYGALLDVFAIVSKQLDARLLILGEGECRNALERQAVSLQIDEQVFMPGHVRDPYPYYRHADLLVLTSTTEGLSNVIIEALEAGTPVVSTDCPSGPREILLDGQIGSLVPVGDRHAMAAAILEALDSEHDTAALTRRARYFSVDRAVDHYLGLLLPQNAPPRHRAPG